ncbi:MAG: PQQ-binding-like beta-propeller repeat protein [Pyrinomonadaceae bacterium]
MKKLPLFLCVIFTLPAVLFSQPNWQANLDSKVTFYQSTDFGLILAGTEKSLYAVDSQTGSVQWRRKTGKINETAVTPVPSTDIVLLSRDLGSKSRLEAVDMLSGDRLWESDKVKGDVMQLTLDPDLDLLAVVVVKDPRGNFGSDFKRKPIVHMLQLSSGVELWKKEMDSSIEMMPARFREGDVDFTLDNYRAPLILDGRLFLFYEGATSFDARSGEEKEREKFKVNEDGLALTEADPVFDDTHIYISGRGRIRAVNRRTGEVDWKANDLGNCAEMFLAGATLYARTGGQFTRLKDGETVEKGPYGISAIDTKDGDVKWRYKGADKGLTNLAFLDLNTLVIADRDDIITVDAVNGKRLSKSDHKVEKAQFVIVNERGEVVVGGRSEIAAFSVGTDRAAMKPDLVRRRSPGIESYALTYVRASANSLAHPLGSASAAAREIWRVKHKAPGRGILRTVAGIALRAAAIYFRYGGVATSAYNFARGGLNLYRTVNSFRFSGLSTRFGSMDLTTLASNAARNYVTQRIYAYGSLARTPSVLNRLNGFQIQRPSTFILGKIKPSREDVQESIFDKIDPARQAEKLSVFLLKRRRLAELRGEHMYFYTEIEKPFDRKGLVGVNVNSGRDTRFILNPDPDPGFLVDENERLLYSSDGSHLEAFDILIR